MSIMKKNATELLQFIYTELQTVKLKANTTSTKMRV